MNKITMILAIIVGVAIGLFVGYMLKNPICVWIGDMLKAKIAAIKIGEVNVGSIASFASIIGFAGTAYGWLKSQKDTLLAKKSAALEAANSQQIAEKLLKVDGMKTDAETKLAEAQQTLEAKTDEFKGMAKNVTFLENENDKLRQTIDTLHETLRRNKLTDGETIVKTKVI